MAQAKLEFEPAAPYGARLANRINGVMTLLALVLAVGAAGQAYWYYLQAPETLWYNVVHDRHAHYDFGLNLGLDLRRGDIAHFVSELHRAQVWGIVHGLLLSLVEAVGGPSIRLAVLPSLLGWIGTAMFAFLTARRLAPRFGNVAGLAALLFVIASPAHKAFATDVMLESLGACLTLACLYAYVVAVQDGSIRSLRLLGLALTLLFLTKYNYWLLAVMGLTAGEFVRNRAAVWSWLMECQARLLAPGWLGRLLRNPLHWPLAATFALFLIGYVADGGMQVSRPTKFWLHPQITLYAAYLLFLARLGLAYYRGGRQWLERQPSAVQKLAAWHVLPILIWFAWPKRLAHCLWYVTRNHGGEVKSFRENLLFYWSSLAEDYHLAMWSLGLMAALLTIGCLLTFRMRRGGLGVVCCLLLIVALNIEHHSKRSRFLHSWVALAWVVAGVGAAQALAAVWPRRLERLDPLVGGLALTGLVALHASGLTTAGHAPEGGCKPEMPLCFDVARTYLPYLAGERQVTLTSNVPMRHWLDWTCLEYSGQKRRVDTVLRGLSFHDIQRESLENWLSKNPSTTLVHVQIHGDSPVFGYFPDHPYFHLDGLLNQQTVFKLHKDWYFEDLKIRVTMWKRSN